MGHSVRKLDKPMTVEEFLKWDSGDDYVWELIDGYPVLKDWDEAQGHAAPSNIHGAITARLGRLLGNRIEAARRPCRVEVGTGTKRNPGDRTYLIPDLAVRCGPSVRDAEDPILVVEVLSPSNSASEMNRKRAFFQGLPSMREIVEVEQDEPGVTVLRRVGDLWVHHRVEGLDATLRLESVDADIPLADLYGDLLPPAEAAEG